MNNYYRDARQGERPINPTKAYLMRVQRFDKRVEALLERKQHYMDMACKATSTMTATRVSGTNTHSNVEDYTCKLIDLEREIDASIDEMVDTKRAIERTIAAVQDTRYRDLLTWRYLNGWTWERIAEGMDFHDVRHVHRLHGEALIKIQNVMECHT